jgi:hypothetical protein
MHTAAIFTDGGVTVLVGNDVFTVAMSHPNYTQIRDAVKAGDYEQVPTLADLPKVVEEYIDPAKYPEFELVDGRIRLHNYTFSDAVSLKTLRMIDAGAPASALRAFLSKVLSNPSASARQELLLFCEANQFMIHADGDIIAYKGVRDDYLDCHSGTVLNKPVDLMSPAERDQYSGWVGSRTGVEVRTDGTALKVAMDRGAVDDRRDHTCSFGLHFAAYGYASTFGQRLVVLKVNPRDVVSIPSDYHNEKGRCCAYEVIAEIPKPQPLPLREVYEDGDFHDEEDEIEETECVSAEEIQQFVVDTVSLYCQPVPDAALLGMTFDELDMTRSQRDAVERGLDDQYAWTGTIGPEDTVADIVTAVQEIVLDI